MEKAENSTLKPRRNYALQARSVFNIISTPEVPLSQLYSNRLYEITEKDTRNTTFAYVSAENIKDKSIINIEKRIDPSTNEICKCNFSLELPTIHSIIPKHPRLENTTDAPNRTWFDSYDIYAITLNGKTYEYDNHSILKFTLKNQKILFGYIIDAGLSSCPEDSRFSSKCLIFVSSVQFFKGELILDEIEIPVDDIARIDVQKIIIEDYVLPVKMVKPVSAVAAESNSIPLSTPDNVETIDAENVL